MTIYRQTFLNLLKAKGCKQYKLVQDGQLSRGTVTALRTGKMVSFIALDKNCQLCRCDISDLIQYEDVDLLNDYAKQD